VEELERQLEEVARSQPPTEASPAVMTDDQEIEQATRTLLLAKRTAEAAISEARAEADKLVADARVAAETSTRDAAAEAERLVRDAQLQREELLRRAKDDAESEFAGQRDRFQSDIARLDGERQRLTHDVDAISARIEEQRNRLASTVKALQHLLDDPSSLAELPPLEVESGTGATSTANAARSPFYSTGAVAAVRVPDDAVSVVDESPESAGADPWGPGSWADVANSEAVHDVDRVQDEEPSAFDREREPGTFDLGEPTQAHLPMGDEHEDPDEAMAAFFEGDEPTSRGRFGRRR
jgi:hypothetical protein